MGYYIGGDREDGGNYTPSGVRKKAFKKDAVSLEQLLDEQPKIVKGFDIPKEFDPDFYLDKQKKYGQYSPDYWEWAKLNKYSQAVFAFYRQTINQFYKKFAPNSALNNFEEKFADIKTENLDELAEGLRAAERNLVSQFDRDNREISAKIKKYPALIRLRGCAAKSWVMYAALNKKLNVKDAVNFKTAYNGFNLDNELDQLKTYRGIVLMQYKLKSINSKFLLNKLNLPKEIYSDLDGLDILNDILEKVNGFKTTDYAELLSEQTIENLNGVYPNLMQIYSNYARIFKLIKLINQNAANWENNIDYFKNDVEDYDTEFFDYYQAGKNVNNLILNLLKTELDPLFELDLKNLNSCLEQALSYANQVYKKAGLNI